MKIVLIDCILLHKNQLDKICQTATDKYISTSQIVCDQFVQRGKAIDYIEDAFTGVENDEIDDIAYALIRNWYKHSTCCNGLCVEGINLGQLVEAELWSIFPQLMKKIAIAQKVLEKYQPIEITIYYQDDELFNVFRHITRYIKSKCNIIGKQIVISDDAKPPWKTRIKKPIRRLLEIGNFLLDAYHYISNWRKASLKRIVISNSMRLHKIEDALSNHYDTIKLVYDYETFFERWRITKSGKRYLSTKFILSFSEYRKIKRKYSQTISFWHHLSQQETFRAIFQYKHIPIYPLVAELFQGYIVKRLFYKAIRDIYMYHRLFQRVSPKLLLQHMDEQGFPTKTAVAVARAMGIKTSTFQHGIDCEERGHEHIYADTALVWGQSRKKRYERYPKNKNKSIHVVGNPDFELLLDTHFTTKVQPTSGKAHWLFVTTTNIRSKLFSAHRSLDEGGVTYNLVLNVLASHPDAQLIVKLHPAEDRTLYEEILATFHPNQLERVKIVKDRNIHELLETATVVLTSCSTVALEAVIFKKPLVLINLEKRNDVIGLNGTQVGIEVTKDTFGIEQVQEAIKLVARDNYPQKALAFLNFHLLGDIFKDEYIGNKFNRSLRRITQVIQRLTHG